ncbi:30S ribosomal protein S1 [Linum perenne]
MYHLDGLVRLSEISWDVTRDARDVLTTGDKVKVRVCKIDRKNTRFELSIKQLQEDPLLQTLDKVLPQDDLVNDASHSDVNGDNTIVEPLPGLTEILKELLLEEGIEDVRITREGFEKRVVSQDLQLWLSNAVPKNGTCILLARAGRQVQEIQLTTTLDQKGIKKVLQHVLERVP